ncbi:MAG: hypothetical protein HOA17_05360 [Candidatus Melainabacteria bacterium]|jgi:glycerophosphoryl diester phosphodiesterase|nr:hypothetical protein [Candidatus Melainabacteria bacterium]
MNPKIALIHHRGLHNFNRNSQNSFVADLTSLAENGLAALTRAAQDPDAMGMEFDVQLCKETNQDPDTAFCVFHDDKLSQVNGDESSLVSKLSLAELSQATAATTNPRFFDDNQAMATVPSFKDLMLALCDYSGTLSIELKTELDDVSEYIQKFKTQVIHIPDSATVIFHSFSITLLDGLYKAILEAYPQAKLACNFANLTDLQRLQNDFPELFKQIDYLYPDFKCIQAGSDSRQSILQLAKQESKQLIPWTVNDKNSLRELIDINKTDPGRVVAFISDNPGLRTA